MSKNNFNKSFRMATAILVVLFVTANMAAAADKAENKALNLLEEYNLEWTTPSENSWGSMPLGNGDIGVNFWVEPDGDFVFYISKTDAWCENMRLLKLGRVRVRFEPNPIDASRPFSQVLDLRNGQITVKAGQLGKQLNLRLWIDAHHPVIQLEVNSDIAVSMQANLELWRTEKRELKDAEAHSAYGTPAPIIVEPDTVLGSRSNDILWCHRNQRSNWDKLGIDKHPELGIKERPDPILNRTFGCLAKGKNLKNISEKTLQSEKPAKNFNLSIYALTSQTQTIEQWVSQIQKIVKKTESLNYEKRYKLHQQWWKDFWTRSWIFIDGDSNARAVTQGYTLQRFMNACAGRGAQPIKFNGSIFTVDLEPLSAEMWQKLPKGADADFRMWGGMYWWQNTRLIYWAMLMAGDFDMMQPFFKTYSDMLPLAKARAKIHYNCDGAVFWEVVPWYGFNITYPPAKEPGYISYYFQGGLEMAAIMLNYFDITQDEKFLRETALPFMSEIVKFYFNNYPRYENGKLRIEPAQALETYWEVINPTPEIAGLDYITERLLAIPEKYTTVQERQKWQDWRKAIPEITTRQLNGVEVISPAGTILKDVRNNMENPEMYAIFPYRRFGIGKDKLDLAIRTYENRIEKRTGGWFYDCIMAAMLGMGDEAAKVVHRNFTVANAIDTTDVPSPFACRFPNFLGPNYDWIPDQDQPSVAMIALQRMLLQQSDSKMLVMPAWPKNWNVFFKLHGNNKTTITGEYRDKKMTAIDVVPQKYGKELIICGDIEYKK